jgi:putative membrane protein
MRFICFLVLAAVAAVVIIFAAQNRQDVTLTFYNYRLTSNVSVLIGAVYVLGMISGWSVVGMLRRSLARVIQTPEGRQYVAH